MTWQLESARFQVSVNPTGAELTRLWDKHTQRNWMWQPLPGIWNNVATQLFPVVGQLIHHGLWQGERFFPLTAHGFLRHHPFRCCEQSATRLVIEACDNDSSRAVWPFAWRMRITWQLTDDGLEIRWQVHNPGNVRWGYSLGWHPGFALPIASEEGWHIRFSSGAPCGPFPTHQRTLVIDGDAPEAKTFPLTAQAFSAGAIYFAGTQRCQIAICSPSGEARIVLTTGDQPWLALWSVPGADLLCVEPLCGTTDAPDFDGQIEHKRGIRWLEPAQTHIHHLAMRFPADS